MGRFPVELTTRQKGCGVVVCDLAAGSVADEYPIVRVPVQGRRFADTAHNGR